MTASQTRPLRLGTRASALAMRQSQLVADELTRLTGATVELVRVTTAGDRSDQPVEQIEGIGVFTTALREALTAGTVDFAVHSYKDLPTDRHAVLVSRTGNPPHNSDFRFGTLGLTIAAVPPREVAYDVLVTATGAALSELPSGARVGTGAPRRVAQLRAVRPDLEYVPLRGNVDTRLGRVGGEVDAVVLAGAALERLGHAKRVSQRLGVAVMVPAPAQGALAVECRAEDTALVKLLSVVDDPLTRATVLAERTVLAELEAGCLAPLGVYGELTAGLEENAGEQFQLHGAVVAIDGRRALRRTIQVTRHELMSDAKKVGQRLAADLLDDGAATLIGEER